MLVSILLLLFFDTVLCIVEIPKMRKRKLYKELWFLSIFLIIGTVFGVLKSLDVSIPNPSDWVLAAYSPISDLVKSILK
jgi:hypothetical protein